MKKRKLRLLSLSFLFIMSEKERERKEAKKVTIFENQNVELKQEYVPEIRKEVIAFANADGGTLIIGIRKDGEVCGIDDPDETMLQVANSLKDAIAPDIMPFVKIQTILMDGKNVVEIMVSTGTNRPYYIKEKGLKPSGVYVRKGSSSQPMTDEGIREMIVQNSARSYEACRSLKQELSFRALKQEMSKRNIEFGEAQMRTLKLIGEDGLYTNLALLLSDQCEVTTKTAIFQGTDKAVFRERQEFTGSIIKQMEDVYHFINLNNKTMATFSGLDRIDIRDYPEEAVREAWMNCLVHRDYSFSASTIINIYDDRMEFVSLGGLVPGLTLDSIFLGISQSRNPNLAALFYRMRLIESFGTGIGKIKRGYDHEAMKPIFETAPGAFRVTLPNCNETQRFEREKTARGNSMYAAEEEKTLIMEYVSENGAITRKETEELIQAGSTKAFRILRELCSAGKLRTEGSGKLIRYVLA